MRRRRPRLIMDLTLQATSQAHCKPVLWPGSCGSSGTSTAGLSSTCLGSLRHSAQAPSHQQRC